VQVVGLSVPEALAQMAFAQPIRAASLKTAIQRAAWNADFYHNIPPAALMVDRAWTGKEICAPRIRYHSKGRAGRSHYRTSRLTVRLRAMTPAEADKLVKFPRAPSPESRASLHPRGY
jgi:ribosomal protein L22